MYQIKLGFQEQTLTSIFRTESTKISKLSLAPGQRLTKHQTNNALVVIVTEGSINFTAMGKTVALSAVEMLSIAPHVEHEVEAIETSVVLLIMITPSAKANNS